MPKAILNNDVLDVIYDNICGYPLEEAYKILDEHRVGKYIPVDWLLSLRVKYLEADCPMSACVVNEIHNLWKYEHLNLESLRATEKENEID